MDKFIQMSFNEQMYTSKPTYSRPAIMGESSRRERLLVVHITTTDSNAIECMAMGGEWWWWWNGHPLLTMAGNGGERREHNGKGSGWKRMEANEKDCARCQQTQRPT